MVGEQAQEYMKKQTKKEMRRNEPIFRIEPANMRPQREKKYTLEDLKDIRWSDPHGDPNLSKKIDAIVYGV